MKRAFDIIFSAIGLILLLPLFSVIAALIRLDSRGPVFFRQRRVGRGFEPFMLYKFRSMTEGASESGLHITAGGDPRVTRVGMFLRKTKLDELPQLLNVLMGDMSLVGPRPEVEKYVNLYRAEYEKILKVRPGITDTASIAFSDEEEMLRGKPDPEQYYVNILLPEKLKCAHNYVKKASLSYDLRLILRTIVRLIYPKALILKAVDALIPYRRPIVIGVEIVIFITANYLAFLIRFEGGIPAPEYRLFLAYLPVLILIRVVSLFSFSIDRGLWRYVGGRDFFRITAAVSAGSLLFFAAVRFLSGDPSYSRSIYVIDWSLTIFFLVGIRLFRQLHVNAVGKDDLKRRIIIIGAGNAADMLIRDIEQSQYYPYEVIGLIDDDPGKIGLKIRGIPVLGGRDALAEIIEREEPDEFIIAIPTLAPQKLKIIMNELRDFDLPVKILPNIWGLLSGRDAVSQIKVVEPEDILFRKPALEQDSELKAFFEGRRVLITGAGGSIGSELSKQAASYSPECLILFERHEESLYKIDLALRSLYPEKPSRFSPIVGDITDPRRVSDVMRELRPEIVFHAAAYKHVPLMEGNPYEAFRTNVFGTKTVAEAAGGAGVKRFILISTDKAVNPINVMGKTKKIAEEVVKALSLRYPSQTSNVIVRFGNVLESSGSVVPLFKEQIKNGGPVTVTHPDIIRYFMTIPEAVALVLKVSAIGGGGEVFVLDMGEPVRILDLARRMICLYGRKPGIDIDIKFTGLRPGEKLYEELFNVYEKVEKTAHPRIHRAVPNGRVDHGVLEALESLNRPGLLKDDSLIAGILARIS